MSRASRSGAEPGVALPGEADGPVGWGAREVGGQRSCRSARALPSSRVALPRSAAGAWGHQGRGSKSARVPLLRSCQAWAGARRASSLSRKLCQEILSYHLKDEKRAERIAKELNSSYPAHQYPITAREARRLGLQIKNLDPETDRFLQQLNLLYSEMGQRAITEQLPPEEAPEMARRFGSAVRL